MQMQVWEEFIALSEDAQQRLLSRAVPRREQRPCRGRLAPRETAEAEADGRSEDEQRESNSRRSRRRRRQRNTNASNKLADGATANSCQG